VADDAFETALRALRHRDRSADEVERRLAEQGYSEEERAEVLDRLDRSGLVDDVRFAHGRAESLAVRGAGDERVRRALREAGVDEEVAQDAIAALEPEPERARRIVARRGAGPKTARYLFAQGFSADVVAAVVATGVGDEIR
jgi:regulatory protein